MLAKRAGFGWTRAAEMVPPVDVHTSGASISVAELVQHTESEHIIVLDELGKGAKEDELLSDLGTEYSHPEVFECASQCRVFSFGGGHRGVQVIASECVRVRLSASDCMFSRVQVMQHGAAWLIWHASAHHGALSPQVMQHGAAWLGLVSGAKLWHVAAPHLPRPSNRECEHNGRIDYVTAKAEGVEHCLMLPGETIWVPDNWWHATCNLDPYTIGLGGQLWLPGQEKNFALRSERPPIEWTPSYGPEVCA